MTGYLIIGAIVAFLLLTGAGRKLLPLPTWRIGAGFGAAVAFAAAGFFALRGLWPVTAMLSMVGLWMAVSARLPRDPGVGERRRGAPPPERRRGDEMSVAEARAILGVSEDATREEINAAYKRLMVRVHPDNGGAPGLAVKLNAARDRLLKR